MEGNSVSVPNDIRQLSLHRDIKILTGLMLRSGYYEEANWLWMAFSSPSECSHTTAETALRNAAHLARSHGFAAVASWIDGDILPPAT